jgi:hypothetical protein
MEQPEGGEERGMGKGEGKKKEERKIVVNNIDKRIEKRTVNLYIGIRKRTVNL